MKTHQFEEDELLEDEEIPDNSGFDLRNKSLINTQKKEAEPKKAVLPLKSIMQGILEKPVSENTQKVSCIYSEFNTILKEESDPKESRKRKEERKIRSY